MKIVRIAIPCTNPGGLEAGIDAHFGHCDLYTLVDIEDGKVAQVETLPSVPHEQGGCLAAVDHLARNGVTVLISGGMGLRPLMGFNQAGIEVLRGGAAASAGAAVLSFLAGGLEPFTREFTCAGGHH